jgi:hypothetical protein
MSLRPLRCYEAALECVCSVVVAAAKLEVLECALNELAVLPAGMARCSGLLELNLAQNALLLLPTELSQVAVPHVTHLRATAA